MADRIAPTPRNKLTGLLADFLGGAYDYAQRPDPTMPMGLANPVLGLLADALPLKSAATVVDDLSYGQAPTRGTGMTTRLTPEATELALNALPFPRTAGKAALMGAGVADMGVPGLERAAIVYHGSPHKFDAFDSSKIGTGEGAQAYGHGLYLAESPETASFYRDKLTSSGTILSRGDALEARSKVLRKVADRVEQTDPARAAKLRAEADTFTRDGALYKVDLPDNAIARMLDWDKPLSQQAPGVRSFFEPQLAPLRKPMAQGDAEWGDLGKPVNADEHFTGAALLAMLRERGVGTDLQNIMSMGGPQVAQRLRAAGIPGIRYLDGGSRGAGQGSSNFVVFPGEENMLKILERNGRSLLD